jgi:hypothetical protein
LDGDFSGLAKVSFRHVAMQRMAPGSDIGFDLAVEYEQARRLRKTQSTCWELREALRSGE